MPKPFTSDHPPYDHLVLLSVPQRRTRPRLGKQRCRLLKRKRDVCRLGRELVLKDALVALLDVVLDLELTRPELGEQLVVRPDEGADRGAV